MKVKVITAFADKNNLTNTFAVGTVLDFDEARATDCVKRGLVEIVEEKKPVAKAKTTTKKPQAK